MAAGADQPQSGAGERAPCLNCGTALVGHHCHGCGQPAHVHRSIGAFFHDLAHGVFHFEGKIWRTLPLLAWRPGQLTREYIDGRRASYVSPIALFLFSVFLMFTVMKQVAGSGEASIGNAPQPAVAVAQAERNLAVLERERAALAVRQAGTAAIDGRIEGARAALDAARTANRATAQSDIPALDHILKAFRDNPGLVLYKLQNNAYKYSWALIPLSVPLVWLLFPFSRRFQLYDHTVFVTYSLCFMSLFAVVLTLADVAGLPLLALAAVLVPPWHMHRQLRGTYGLSRGAALWRTAALLLFALLALAGFAVLIAAQSG